MDKTLLFTIIGIGLLFWILTCFALYDLGRKDFPTRAMKLVWGMVVFLIPFIGCVVYFIFGSSKGKLKQQTSS